MTICISIISFLSNNSDDNFSIRLAFDTEAESKHSENNLNRLGFAIKKHGLHKNPEITIHKIYTLENGVFCAFSTQAHDEKNTLLDIYPIAISDEETKFSGIKVDISDNIHSITQPSSMLDLIDSEYILKELSQLKTPIRLSFRKKLLTPPKFLLSDEKCKEIIPNFSEILDVQLKLKQIQEDLISRHANNKQTLSETLKLKEKLSKYPLTLHPSQKKMEVEIICMAQKLVNEIKSINSLIKDTNEFQVTIDKTNEELDKLKVRREEFLLQTLRDSIDILQKATFECWLNTINKFNNSKHLKEKIDKFNESFLDIAMGGLNNSIPKIFFPGLNKNFNDLALLIESTFDKCQSEIDAIEISSSKKDSEVFSLTFSSLKKRVNNIVDEAKKAINDLYLSNNQPQHAIWLGILESNLKLFLKTYADDSTKIYNKENLANEFKMFYAAQESQKIHVDITNIRKMQQEISEEYNSISKSTSELNKVSKETAFKIELEILEKKCNQLAIEAEMIKLQKKLLTKIETMNKVFENLGIKWENIKTAVFNLTNKAEKLNIAVNYNLYDFESCFEMIKANRNSIQTSFKAIYPADNIDSSQQTYKKTEILLDEYNVKKHKFDDTFRKISLEIANEETRVNTLKEIQTQKKQKEQEEHLKQLAEEQKQQRENLIQQIFVKIKNVLADIPFWHKNTRHFLCLGGTRPWEHDEVVPYGIAHMINIIDKLPEDLNAEQVEGTLKKLKHIADHAKERGYGLFSRRKKSTDLFYDLIGRDFKLKEMKENDLTSIEEDLSKINKAWEPGSNVIDKKIVPILRP